MRLISTTTASSRPNRPQLRIELRDDAVDKEASQVNTFINAYGRREGERVSDSGRCGWRSASTVVSRLGSSQARYNALMGAPARWTASLKVEDSKSTPR